MLWTMHLHCVCTYIPCLCILTQMSSSDLSYNVSQLQVSLVEKCRSPRILQSRSMNKEYQYDGTIAISGGSRGVSTVSIETPFELV